MLHLVLAGPCVAAKHRFSRPSRERLARAEPILFRCSFSSVSSARRYLVSAVPVTRLLTPAMHKMKAILFRYRNVHQKYQGDLTKYPF